MYNPSNTLNYTYKPAFFSYNVNQLINTNKSLHGYDLKKTKRILEIIIMSPYIKYKI